MQTVDSNLTGNFALGVYLYTLNIFWFTNQSKYLRVGLHKAQGHLNLFDRISCYVAVFRCREILR